MCQKYTLKQIKVKAADSSGASVVEVAVIIPMIWIILMGSIFLLFFFLDMGVIKSETIRTANEVSEEWRLPEHKSIDEEKSLLRERINQRLVLTKLNQESISVSLGTVTVTAEVNFFLSGKGLSFSNTAKAAVNKRETWFRIMSH